MWKQHQFSSAGALQAAHGGLVAWRLQLNRGEQAAAPTLLHPRFPHSASSQNRRLRLVAVRCLCCACSVRPSPFPIPLLPLPLSLP